MPGKMIIGVLLALSFDIFKHSKYRELANLKTLGYNSPSLHLTPMANLGDSTTLKFKNSLKGCPDSQKAVMIQTQFITWRDAVSHQPRRQV